MSHDPRTTARLAGALWLIVIVAGVVAVLSQSALPRVAFSANQFAGVCYLGVTVLLYALFKPVNPSLALFAAVCGVTGVASGSDTSPTNPASPLFLVSMVFFGFQILSIGYMITRSTLIPRALGVLLMLGGASYVINSFTNFLSPALGTQLMPFVVPIAILAEGCVTLWLLVRGVRAT